MSIKKIAEITGTSISTVSRVLNNPDYKCKDKNLRKKIWDAAISINYVPNESARNLKKGSVLTTPNYCIDILLTRSDNVNTDPFFDELLNVIESQLHKNSCILSNVWHYSAFSDNSNKAMREVNGIIEEMAVNKSEVDGLIIIGRCNKEAVRKLKERFENVIAVNRNSINYEIDEVLCDGAKIASMAVEYLIKKGHKNIAYVGNIKNETRFNGYIATMKKYELEVMSDYIYDVAQTEKQGYKTMEEVLKEQDKPTAFYCANDIMAVGMIKSLNHHRNRYYMPSIIASDNIEQSQYTSPMLTTVNLPRQEMGRFAVELLLDRIKGGHSNVIKFEIEGNIVVRESVTCVDETYITEYCI